MVHPECIDLLLEQGGEVDLINRGDETALMRATYMGEEDCVERLLKAGANPTLEFAPFAKVMLDMDEEMTAFIDDACDVWKRSQRRSKKAKKASKKKK